MKRLQQLQGLHIVPKPLNLAIRQLADSLNRFVLRDACESRSISQRFLANKQCLSRQRASKQAGSNIITASFSWVLYCSWQKVRGDLRKEWAGVHLCEGVKIVFSDHIYFTHNCKWASHSTVRKASVPCAAVYQMICGFNDNATTQTTFSEAAHSNDLKFIRKPMIYTHTHKVVFLYTHSNKYKRNFIF